MVSSRKEENVTSAVEALRKEKIEASGVVCHAGKRQDVNAMLRKVLVKD